MSHFKTVLLGLTISPAAAAAAAVYLALPTYNSIPVEHEPVSTQECELLRTVKGESVASASNPGVRAYENFMTPAERRALVAEVQPLKQRYGISLITPQHAAMYRWQMGYIRQSAVVVNMLRITGRPEHEYQKIATWGYADAFAESGLPPKLRALADKIRSIPGLKLGKLRDVTINYRHSYFYRLDPHVDPVEDGENVFIVGLDADTVLTLCPERWWQLQQWWDLIRGFFVMEDERDLVRRRAEQSWTDYDIDVLARAGTLVHLSGDARWKWTHGTRLGVEMAGEKGIHDWWGLRSHVVKRSPERHSLVFAFDRAQPPERKIVRDD